MLTVDTGFVFALRQEAVGILDRLKRPKITRGDGYTFYTGTIGEMSIAIVLSGVGQNNAEEAAKKLIEVFEPKSVCSAGYAGGLSERFKHFSICVPEQILRESDNQALDVSQPIPQKTQAMPGKLTLITVNDVAETPKQKQLLREKTGADIVDMETFAVAEVCRCRNVPFCSFRVVVDTVSDRIPKDIAKILGSLDKGMSRLSGTILGNIWSRPSVVLDFIALKKCAFTATERLARFALAELSQKKNDKTNVLEYADNPPDGEKQPNHGEVGHNSR
jgi:adenosylhomocysteine nucleosidase